MWYVWLILAGIFMIGEMLTTGFLIFWLGLGALLAMLVSFITDSCICRLIYFIYSFYKTFTSKVYKKG